MRPSRGWAAALVDGSAKLSLMGGLEGLRLSLSCMVPIRVCSYSEPKVDCGACLSDEDELATVRSPRVEPSSVVGGLLAGL